MQERNIAVSIILTIITCGIYGIYWFIVLTDEAKKEAKDEQMMSGGLCFILTLITCGIFGFYWAYKMGKILQIAKEKNSLNASDNSVLYLVLQIFGLGIVNYAIMQNELNEITRNKADATTVKQA